MQKEYSEFTLAAIQAALQAGEIIRNGFGSLYEVSAKPGRQNYVTFYDKKAENAIFAYLRNQFPSHSFLGEESGLTEGESGSIMWVVDPLDGTTNFSRHIPIFSVSIAACYENKPLCGVIYQPMTNELFVAERERGAYLNDEKIHASQIKTLEEALIGVGFPYSDYKEPVFGFPHLEYLVEKGASLRNLGSAALSLAYVAAGKLDAVCMNQLYPWDWFAGKIIVEEAGGQICSYPNTDQASSVLGSNPFLFPLIDPFH